MRKIICSFLIVMLMFTYSFAGVVEDSADVLVKMKLLNGYPDGTLQLENNITRAEFCSIIIRMIGKNQAPEKSRFSDVAENHWAYGVINRAAELGFLKGYEDGTFRPSNNITYAECCSILVNLLGYSDEIEGAWPTNVMNKAHDLKLNVELENMESSHLMTRGEVSVMLVNSMNVKIKGEK